MKTIIVVLLCTATTLGQPRTPPVDTSFSASSAAAEVTKKYPFARLAEARLPAGVSAQYDIVYAAHGNRTLHCDLFSPADSAAGPFPLVLIFHGGGWRSGNRTMEIPIAQQLAARGFAAATVEYRLSGEARYPAGVFDLKECIRWMRAHAESLHVDPDRFAVMGFSAGGTLAALLGTTGGMPRFEGEGAYRSYSSRVQAVIDGDGIVDFRDPAESGKDTDPAKPSAGRLWFGATFAERPDLWADASPLLHVTPECPPIAFINSAQERFHAGRDAMITELDRYGIYHEVHSLPETPHPFWLFQPWTESVIGYSTGFLTTVFRPSQHITK